MRTIAQKIRAGMSLKEAMQPETQAEEILEVYEEEDDEEDEELEDGEE